ncbi:MAG TPA: HDIG domain-containing protein [Nannocystaceae bacterium]|nr:HDIG domain-containing protein [Nannocystaceae bacterium]
MSSPMPTPSTNEWSPEDLLAPLALIAAEATYPPKHVTAHIAESAARVLEIPPARVYELLTPALCSKVPHLVLQWLRDAGLLVHLLPELDATHAFSQEADRRHKDVWEHTKAVVWQAVPRPAVRWGAVLHDIGKVTTRRFGPAGKVTFHGHAEEGVRMFRRTVVKRIGFPPDVQKQVELLIRHHLRAGQYDGSWTDSAVRRFHREMQPFLRDLLDLSRADVTSRRPGKRKKALFMISGLAKRMRELEEAAAKVHPLPPGLGNELMVALALPPGKHIGELRARLEALHEAGDLEGGREPAYYVEVVRERGLLDGLEIVPPRGWTPPAR